MKKDYNEVSLTNMGTKDTKEIIVCVVQHENYFLILKRQPTKHFDPNRWEFVSVFTNGKDFTAQAKSQVLHETGAHGQLLKSGTPFEANDEYGTWLIHPFLFKSDTATVQLQPQDHSEYRWIKPEELKNFEAVKDLEGNLVALGLLKQKTAPLKMK